MDGYCEEVPEHGPAETGSSESRQVEIELDLEGGAGGLRGDIKTKLTLGGFVQPNKHTFGFENNFMSVLKVVRVIRYIM